MRTDLIKRIVYFYRSERLLSMIISVGVILQARQYLFNRSLWLDEGVLASTLLYQPFEAFLKTKTAPLGFYAIVKPLTAIFGSSEYVLRLFPFLCGILSLFVFCRVAKKFVEKDAVPVALFFFAINERIIWYASEFKQYSCDVLVALSLLLIPSYIKKTGLSNRNVLLIGAAGILGICFSFPSIFILSGISVCLLVPALKNNDRESLKKIAAFSSIWFAGFATSYFVILNYLSNRASLAKYWAGTGAAYRDTAFMPLPPLSLPDLMWFPRNFSELIVDPLGFPLVPIAAMAIFYGIFTGSKNNTKKVSLLVIPILFTLFASGMQKYPFRGRLLLFLVPVFLLFVSEGITKIKLRSPSFSLFLKFVIFLSLVSSPLIFTSKAFVFPRKGEDVRSVMSYIKDNSVETDFIYSYYGATGPLKYYIKRLALDEDRLVVGSTTRGSTKAITNEITKLVAEMQIKKAPRAWLVFAHKYALRVDKVLYSEENVFLYYFDRIGTRVDSYQGSNASCYLYDLRLKPSKKND